MVDVQRLPRGRHDLTREQVEEAQRLRILVGLAEAMADGGYVNTPVATVIRHAGVSRETYYRLFDDKLDGFLAAFDLVSVVIMTEMVASVEGEGSPLARVDRASARYLQTIADHRAFARLFLVETYAAGAVAIERRAVAQRQIVDLLADELGSGSDAARFACETVVAAVSSMITLPIVADDPAAILTLGPAVSAHLHRLHDAGLFD